VSELADSRVLVVGLGRFGGGLGATRWLIGAGAKVTVTDSAEAETLRESLEGLASARTTGRLETVLGGHEGIDPAAFDLVVANPAVPPSAPLLAAARDARVPITSEVELYLERTNAAVVAVTGTQGKSSTVTFATQLARAAGIDAAPGGNLGGSLLASLEAERPGALRLLELSSYQLEALSPAPPRVARAVAVTTVLPDHLDRHGDLESYASAKARVLELLQPGGAALLPSEGPLAAIQAPRARVSRHGPGAELEVGSDHLLIEGQRLRAPLTQLAPFQRANALLAAGLYLALGLDPERLESGLAGLEAPEHRAQHLGQVNGRRVVDNGVATTPDATLGALEGLPPGATLLAGGRSKGLDWSELAATLARQGHRTISFGEAAGEIAAACAEAGAEVEAVPTLELAVQLGLERTPQGAVLLFSPGCSSFDAHPNFRERAAAFRAALAVCARGGTSAPTDAD
jgi:UDP-N-acetylmuramoylalanine--D-glutamate ligase